MSIGGTTELEIEVSNFEKTNDILKALGYNYRNYQKNRGITYNLDDIEIDIDFLPLVPPYVEIEGKNEEDVKRIIEKLSLNNNKIPTYVVIDIYNIDILIIKNLSFKE